jgi:ribosome maturation factor RimP
MALQLEAIRAAAERAAESLRLEVVEAEFTGGAKFRTLRVFIEKNAEERAKLAAAVSPNEAGLPSNVPAEQLSGVTHDDCESFARDFGTVLDVEDLIPGAEYTLEVSSPGLDRRLRSASEFERFIGSKVKVQTFTAVNGNRHWTGRLLNVDGGRLTLDISEAKAKGKAAKAAVKAVKASKGTEATVELELANVEKANLVPEI